MGEAEMSGGDVVVYAKVRDPEARGRLRQLLDDLPGERISDHVYEVYTADWDQGLWDQEVERMVEIITPGLDTLVFWKVIDGRLVRTSLSGRST